MTDTFIRIIDTWKIKGWRHVFPLSSKYDNSYLFTVADVCVVSSAEDREESGVIIFFNGVARRKKKKKPRA
jgi:hypothetical protein